jgi:aldehyde dehydrogenase (NAD+)
MMSGWPLRQLRKQPVLVVLTYKTLEEAIDIANNTNYGLEAYVHAADLIR